MIYLPILGALALAGGLTLERIVLKKKKIDIKSYTIAGFLAIVLVMIPLIYFFWQIDSKAFQSMNLLIFSLVVLFSIIANLFTFYALKQEKVSNLEPARVMEPLFAILLAIVFSFFASGLYERNLNIILPALIAGAALVFSRFRKSHLYFNKYFLALILGSFFFALELVTSRLILDYYSPLTFYFLRCAFILLASWLIFLPKLEVDKTSWIQIFVTGAIFVLYRTIVYYGYLNLGVIFTTLILMLGPVFVFAFAKIFLKEKLDWRNIVAAFVVVACVAYAMLA